MRAIWLLLMALCGCEPAGPGLVRVVNATATTLRATLDGNLMAGHLGAIDATPFLAVPAGLSTLEVTGADQRELLATTAVEALTDEHLTVLVMPAITGARVKSVAHRFAPPSDMHIRVRLVHAAESPVITIQLQQVTQPMAVGSDSGFGGFALPANTPTSLVLDGEVFTIPALPARSEVLLVVLQSKPGLAVLGVTPSAVLGFLGQGATP